MAKGEQRGNREAKKPKKEKIKTIAAAPSQGARLACYDAAFPPPKKERPTAGENYQLRAAYKDPFVAEDARTRAKLNNICRGC